MNTTIINYFHHYYKNLGFNGRIWAVLRLEETKIQRAMVFGELYHNAISMETPLALVNTTKGIPPWPELPAKLQEVITSLELDMESLQDYFDDSLRKKFEGFLESANEEKIKHMMSEVERLWEDFFRDYNNKLKDFPEKYGPDV